MTRSIRPETFTVERSFDHPVALLFWAFTDVQAKRVWYGGEGNWEVTGHTLDFRVGGTESWRGRRSAGDPWMTNEAVFYDILPEQRIIHSYVMTMDDKLFTVSQQVLEFSSQGAGSHIRLTEQILFIDGVDHLEDRIGGTRGMLDNLNAHLDTVKAERKPA